MFRIVFISAVEVTDIRVSEIIMDMLIQIFPECDKACRDVSRIFLGGKSIIFASECYLSLSDLMMEYPRFLKDKYDEKHYKKYVEEFTVKHNLERCGGFAYISKKQSDKKFLNAKEDFLCKYEIIIDEDILLSSVKNSVSVLKEDILKLKKYSKVQNLFRKLKNRNDEYILTEPCDSYISYKTITKMNISTNVNAFMRATAIHIGDRYINCFIPPDFQKVKYTILSATANEDVYKLFFKDKLINYMECREARCKAKLIQDCSRSYSRRDIDGDEELFDKIIKENPNVKHIITFMKYKQLVNNCMIHYGNKEGCDYMKGEDIVVVGVEQYLSYA